MSQRAPPSLVKMLYLGILLWILCASCPAFATSGGSSWCNCDTLITVDPGSSLPCESVRNSTCNSLQKALDAVAGETLSNTDSCVAIQLLPGNHILTKTVTITQNVVILVLILFLLLPLPFQARYQYSYIVALPVFRAVSEQYYL